MGQVANLRPIANRPLLFVPVGHDDLAPTTTPASFPKTPQDNSPLNCFNCQTGAWRRRESPARMHRRASQIVDLRSSGGEWCTTSTGQISHRSTETNLRESVSRRCPVGQPLGESGLPAIGNEIVGSRPVLAFAQPKTSLTCNIIGCMLWMKPAVSNTRRTSGKRILSL
jgi:hypothetical protein